MLDLEMPGALPEIAPSPEYDPFDNLLERAMFMQAWSSYGVQWPIISDFLGIRPDVPGRRLVAVPDVPARWPGLSVQNLRVGRGVMAASTERTSTGYATSVTAPGGLALTIGQVVLLR